MAELTLEQKRAIAMANARLRMEEETQEPAGLTLPRAAQLATRGAAPVLTGAGLGGALAGPPGMLAGSMALPAADLVASGMNRFSGAVEPVASAFNQQFGKPPFEQMQVQPPSRAASNLMERMGLTAPQTSGERAIEAGGAGLAMPASQLPALQALSRTAATPAARGVATTLSQAPTAQMLSAAPSAAVNQYVTEETGNPMLGMGAGMLTALPFGIGSKRTQVDRVPTREELKKLSTMNYETAKASSMVFKEQPFKQTIQGLKNSLIDDGFDPDLHPKVNSVIKRLETDSSPKTIQQLDTLRKVARSAAGSNDPAERMFGSRIIEQLDDFIDNAQPNQVIAQDKTAIESLKTARNLYAQNKKAEILEDIFNTAELRATANYSQSGMEQALRTRLVGLAANKKQMRAFTPNEQSAIKQAAKGGSMQNLFRMLGKQSPVGGLSQFTGPSIGAMIGAAVTGGSPVGAAVGAAAVPAASSLARGQSTRMGLASFRNLENMLLLGRPQIPTVPVSGAMAARGAVPGLLQQNYLDRNARIDDEER
jgi:hypothetical protein